MTSSPVLFFCYVIGLLLLFFVLPVGVVCRLKVPKWTKGLLAFNYFALIVILFIQIGAAGSLFAANKVAKRNLTTLVRVLRDEPDTKVVKALEQYLAHDESSYFLLSEQFPEPEEKE